MEVRTLVSAGYCLLDWCTTCSGSNDNSGPVGGYIEIEPGWQIITCPVVYGYWSTAEHKHIHDNTTKARFKNYVLDQIEDLYGVNKVEVANTFLGDVQSYYSYVVGSTPQSSPHNFYMSYEDSGVTEYTGFWIKSINNVDMLISWGEV